MVYEKELEEGINNSLTRRWSHLVDLSNGIKKLGGGGVQIAGAEDEEDSEKRERNREKKKKGGGKLVTRRPKRGRNLPVACGA